MRTASLPPALTTLGALALVACAALQPLAAAAQIQPCTAIENDAERLACYDRALRPAPAPAPAQTPKASAPAAAAPAAAAPSSTVATEDRASRRERRARESAAEATASAAPAAPAAVDPIAPAPRASTATPAAPAAPEAPRARRGAAKAEAEEPATVPIVVVQIRALPGRAATFVTDKGDTWIQTDTNHTQYPQTPFKASIEPGAMSSFFLIPENRGRAIRVRRGE